MCNKNRQSGFTLVELAIVIVIIGFIVAGISAGSSLIKQAQIRSVITDFTSFQVGYNNFLGRYNAVPGDFSSAASYWPAGASVTTNCNTSGATVCNGNGNGLIEFSTDGAGTGISETRLAWRHLALAGMVGAGISQLTTANTLSTNGQAVGTTAPVGKISGTGYVMAGYYVTGANNYVFGTTSSPWAGTGKNSVYMGRAAASPDTSGLLSNGSLNPDDAFAIDQKMDDGAISGTTFTGANTGVIRAALAANANSGTYNATSTQCTGGAAAADASLYRIPTTSSLQFEGCLVGFQLN